MAQLNKLTEFLRKKEFDDIDSENYQKFIFLSFSLFLSLVINVLFAFYHFFYFEKLTGIVLFILSVFFFSLYLYYRKTDNYKYTSISTAIILTIEYALILLSGKGQMTGIFWGLVIPVFLSLTVNKKRFVLFSSICLLIALIIFFVPAEFFIIKYPSDIKIRFIFLYLTLFFLLHFNATVKQQLFNSREKKNLDFQKQIGSKNRFLSDISYQIRLPLNNIAGIVNHKRSALGEETVENIELSIGNIISVMNLIPHISDKGFTSIKGNETGFNINTVIKKSVDLFQTNKYDNLRISLNLSSKMPLSVYGDRLSLIQILISSIDFFYDKTSSSNRLEIVSKEKSADSVLVQIKSKLKNLDVHNDSLPKDMAGKELKYIFDMVESIKGKLDISSDDSYLSFTFTFNFKSSISLPNEEESENKINDKLPFTESDKKIQMKDANILLVEDDDMNSKVMILNLEKLVKKIIIAKNGKEAVEKFTTTKTDLILMDLRMPLMDGFKATEKIREVEKGTNLRTPIIAVTAYASSETRKQCLDAGMNDYTTKPVNFNILIKKIESLLN